MNPHLASLHPYPFERIRQLLAANCPPEQLSAISFAIGEPKHQPPAEALTVLKKSVGDIALYPSTKGTEALRTAICQWLCQRFKLGVNSLDPNRHVLPVNGTREALFAIAQTLIDPSKKALVISPNPFYQIYEGAALLAGATPYYVNTLAENAYIPDFDKVPTDVWQRCQLMYLCSPGNPTGAILPAETLKKLIKLADKYDFIIASDECYSEIYPNEDQPPVGILEVCAQMGRPNFERCLAFHSLSKRSNLPGLRSGFVAGDSHILEKFLLYRTYHGCAMPIPSQLASIAAWNDEKHVVENRQLYRQKFDDVLSILSPVMEVEAPEAGFYLWPKTPIDDQLFCQQLHAQQHVHAVPGSFLARDTAEGNPGQNRIRLALVATPEECHQGAWRIRHFIENL